MNMPAILTRILEGYRLPVRGCHGVTHWARVLENGLRLAEHTGANVEVVTLFALFHDSRRQNDIWDPGQCFRGAQLALSLRGESLISLSDADFKLLFHACEHHTEGRIDGDITVQTCWDADRLDLGRVGVWPHPAKLCTEAARSTAMIDWALARSQTALEPEFVRKTWKVED